MKLITKFTNISDKDFDVRYDGKVVVTVPAGETIDLPIPEAKAGAKALANKVLGQRGNFTTWNEDMVKRQAEILNEVPGDVEATPEEDSEVPAEDKVDYSKMTAKELMTELENAGISYLPKMKKAELIELLENPPKEDDSEEEEFPEEDKE